MAATGSIRVHELAKELKKSNREVSDRLRKLEIPAPTNLSSVSPEDANRVRVSFGLAPLKIEKPKKKAAKKPAAKKAEKPAKKAARPAVKKAEKPAKKAAKPAAKKAEKPAKKAAKPAVKKAEKPAKAAAKKPAKAAPVAKATEKMAEKPVEAVAVKEKPAQPPTVKAKAPPAAPAAPPAKAAARPAVAPARAPSPQRPPGGEAPPRKPPARPAKPVAKKPTLRVAPAERKPARPKVEGRKVYRFVPRGKSAPTRASRAPTTVAPKLLRVPSGVTVKEFAQKAGLKPAEVIRKMMGFGEMLTVNQAITDDALRLLAEDLGVEIKIKAGRVEELEEIVDRPEDLVTKPPVVTVMGHVDHGKTLLLDAIRKTDVVSSETGGITQHIGAYQVSFHDKPITFIDTPGHESFTAMRARGAQITDIAILVVAADDGVMPQTVEALDHAMEAEVPTIVAVNKMDKPDADAYRVRQQLSERGLIPDDWGGETVFVDISAKEGTNIDHLLEMILLVAELQELKADPHGEVSGVVIEAKLDKARGPVATVLIQRGTAAIGDVIVVGTAWGRIRAMFDDKGENLESAGPSIPVEILGLSSLPMAGDEFRVVEEEKKARQITDRRRTLKKTEEQVGPPRHISLENLFDRIKEGELNQLKVVLKADTQGSLEAIKDALDKLPSEEVRLEVIHNGVGGISETDIMLASASDAIVLGFHVRPDANAAKVAERESVEIRTYQVIYKLTEDMEAALKGLLAPIFEEEVTGRVEIRQLFRVPGAGVVAGCYVLEGEVNRNSQVRVIRDGVVVFEGKLSSLKRFKDDVKSVASGFECGMSVEDFQDLKDGDILEVYRMREVER